MRRAGNEDDARTARTRAPSSARTSAVADQPSVMPVSRTGIDCTPMKSPTTTAPKNNSVAATAAPTADDAAARRAIGTAANLRASIFRARGRLAWRLTASLTRNSRILAG